MALTHLDSLRADVEDKQVVTIVGTGVSLSATGNNALASWKGLLQNGVARCMARRPPSDDAWAQRTLEQIDGDLIDLLCAAENISYRLGAPKDGEYVSWLKDTVGKLPIVDPTIVEALKALQAPIATTNYDYVIETAAVMRETSWLDRDDVDSFVRGKSDKVLHLHGHWEKPESVILGIRSYEDILRDLRIQNALRALRSARTLLFVGFGAGLHDPNFGALLRWSGEIFFSSSFPAYQLCLDSERQMLDALHAGRGIYAIPYGTAHADLPAFLQGLCK